MSRSERRHPATVPTEPGECAAKAQRPSDDVMRARARLGGILGAAALSPEELSAKMKRVRQARTDKENARRAAAGRPPLAPSAPVLGDDEMRFWLSVVDERFPGRQYTNRMQRRRLAVALAREAVAKAARSAFGEGDA